MMAELFSLKGKNILVTGASSGIGRSIAIHSSQQEANVIITGRSLNRLEDTFNSLEGAGHQKIICDLTQQNDINDLVDRIPSCNGIVFCAGAIDYMPAKQINSDSLNSILKLNFESQILLYQALHTQKKLAKGASLIFISSVAATSAVSATLAYSASKAAINSSVRVLASELSKFKIRVNSISPGLIKTQLLETSNVDESTFAENEKKYPLGFPEAHDIANAVIFLLSDATQHITGINLVVDGGYLLHQ